MNYATTVAIAFVLIIVSWSLVILQIILTVASPTRLPYCLGSVAFATITSIAAFLCCKVSEGQ